jgi:quercetin dioxygenase-like cupin family protein
MRETNDMKNGAMHLKTIVGATILTMGIVCTISFEAAAHDEKSGGEAKVLFSQKLPNAPGKTLTAVLVTYGPGEKTLKHHHAGSVFAFVVSGTIRSENSVTGPARDYKAGESFFEPDGSVHLVSANASATEAASLLAVFIADDGAQLTTMD